MVEALIKAGCNVDKARKDGATPLYGATVSSKGVVVDMLIKDGCNVDKAEKDGAMPRYAATKNSKGVMVEALIKAGCNVDKARKMETGGCWWLHLRGMARWWRH